jgi:hypothetical protein
VARQVALRDEAAEALAQHDGLDDAQRVAQAHHVVGKGVQRPLARGRRSLRPWPRWSYVDDLRHVGQAAEQRLEAAVVEARAAVQQHQRGLLAHRGPSGTRPGLRCRRTGARRDDAVVNALPYHLALTAATQALEAGCHYFDLTEDVAATRAIMRWPKAPRPPSCRSAAWRPASSASWPTT